MELHQVNVLLVPMEVRMRCFSFVSVGVTLVLQMPNLWTYATFLDTRNISYCQDRRMKRLPYLACISLPTLQRAECIDTVMETLANQSLLVGRDKK